MASIGQLVRVVAEMSGLEDSAVKLIARYVREAGLIGQRSTGGGAAVMTSADAAALLIAVNGTALAKDAAEAVKDFCNLPAGSAHEITTVVAELKEIGDRLSSADSFGACLAMLIEICSSPEGQCLRSTSKGRSIEIKIIFERPRSSASIVILEHNQGTDALQLVFGRGFESKKSRQHDAADRSVAVTIGERTIVAVSDIIAD